MTNLRKDASGQPCLIRVPDACCFDPARVVLCHVRLAGLTGMGLKNEDLLAAFGCQPCHDIVDGRTRSDYTYEQRRLMLLEAVMRTQAMWIKRGLIKW